MVNSGYATSQTQVSVGVETTRGTASSTPLWLPIKGPKYKPDLMLIADNTLQGSAVELYDQVRGLRYDSHGWESFPYLDSMPVLVRALLGSADTVTAAPTSTTLAASATAGATTISATASIAAGSWIVIDTGANLESHLTSAVSGAGPYAVTLTTPLNYGHANAATVTGLTKHTFSLLNNAGSGNQPPSCTINDFDGDQWRQITAAQLDKLNVKGTPTGLVDVTVDWMGNPAVTPGTPSPSYTSVQAPPSWTATMALGGTVVPYVEDWEFDFTRKVKPIPALTGTQNYFMYFADALGAEGKLTVIEQTGAPELATYLAGTQETLDLTFFDLKNGYVMNIHSTKAQFSTGELNRGKQYVSAQLGFKLLPTATDATSGGVSPVKITIANAQTTAY